MTELISSATNPLAKRLRQLLGPSGRKFRRQEGVFVVEGIQPAWRAIEQSWDVETLVIAPELIAERAAGMVAEQEALGVRVARLTSELFTRLSDREGPSGLMAIVRTRSLSLEEVLVPPDAVFVVLDRVANPGNLGTIMRTVDAAGGDGLLLIGETTDPFAPGAIKASMGSVFGLTIAQVQNAAGLVAWARSHALQLVATSGTAAQSHWGSTFQRPLALLLGSERQGLSAELLAAADLRVRIPMTGTAESLNLAVAAGVMLYEVQRHTLD